MSIESVRTSTVDKNSLTVYGQEHLSGPHTTTRVKVPGTRFFWMSEITYCLRYVPLYEYTFNSQLNISFTWFPLINNQCNCFIREIP